MVQKSRKGNHEAASVSSKVEYVGEKPEVLEEEAGIHQAMNERIAWLENVISKLGSAVTPDAH